MSCAGSRFHAWLAAGATVLALVAGPALADDPAVERDAAPTPNGAGVIDGPARSPQAAGPQLPYDAGGGPIEAELAFRAAMEAEHHDTAVDAGHRWVDLLEQAHGSAHPALAEPLTDVARAERLAGHPDEAEILLLRALNLVREHGGRQSEDLLDPLVELGQTYQDMGEHTLAISTFTEAQGLSRRLHGLLNPDQIEMINGAALSLVMLGAYEEAAARQLEAFQLSERYHGTDSLDLLPAIYRHARWKRQFVQFHDERLLYVRAMRLISDQADEHDLRMIVPLRALVTSKRAEFGLTGHLRGGTGYPSAEQALRRALEIARAQSPPTPDVEARLLIDMGDWNMLRARRRAALDRYAEAWELLERERPELLPRWFDSPAVISQPQPAWTGIHPRGSRPGLSDGVVVARYLVDERGQARDIEIIESVPEGLKDSTVTRTLQRSRFRPKIIDGEPVRADGPQYSFRFGYQP